MIKLSQTKDQNNQVDRKCSYSFKVNTNLNNQSNGSEFTSHTFNFS